MKAQKNPFRSNLIAELRFAIEPTELAGLAHRILDKPGGYALIGPHGTGKTTLLEDLDQRITQTPEVEIEIRWIRLNQESSSHERKQALEQLLNPIAGIIYFLDGGEVLNVFDWWRIKRSLVHKQLRVTATLHKPNGITSLLQTSSDWTLALDCISKILGEAPDKALRTVAKEAFKESNGNIRTTLRACYWEYARR